MGRTPPGNLRLSRIRPRNSHNPRARVGSNPSPNPRNKHTSNKANGVCRVKGGGSHFPHLKLPHIRPRTDTRATG